jgi:hypothetical protein
MNGTFRLVRFDEGGPVETDRSIRLVCVTEEGTKVAIWGASGIRHNIDEVLRAGLPCTIRCEYRTPETWARNDYEHSYWVPQHASLEIVTR